MSVSAALPRAEAMATGAGHGRVSLAFTRDGARTVLARQFSQAPLHVQRVLHGTGACAEVALLNVAGGVLAGDRLDCDVTVGPRACVRVRTIGATRLYRAAGDVPARSYVRLRLAPGALLEYVPDEVIPYAGALYEQRTELDLAPGARAIVTEVIGPGRLHRGEVFAYRRLTLRVRAGQDGMPLLRERLTLEPAAWPLDSTPLLGPYTHLASLYAFGPGADASLASSLHDLLAARDVHGSATTGRGDVVVVRATGHSAFDLTRLLHEAMAQCRQCMLAP